MKPADLQGLQRVYRALLKQGGPDKVRTLLHMLDGIIRRKEAIESGDQSAKRNFDILKNEKHRKIVVDAQGRGIESGEIGPDGRRLLKLTEPEVTDPDDPLLRAMEMDITLLRESREELESLLAGEEKIIAAKPPVDIPPFPALPETPAQEPLKQPTPYLPTPAATPGPGVGGKGPAVAWSPAPPQPLPMGEGAPLQMPAKPTMGQGLAKLAQMPSARAGRQYPVAEPKAAGPAAAAGEAAVAMPTPEPPPAAAPPIAALPSVTIQDVEAVAAAPKQPEPETTMAEPTTNPAMIPDDPGFNSQPAVEGTPASPLEALALANPGLRDGGLGAAASPDVAAIALQQIQQLLAQPAQQYQGAPELNTLQKVALALGTAGAREGGAAQKLGFGLVEAQLQAPALKAEFLAKQRAQKIADLTGLANLGLNVNRENRLADMAEGDEKARDRRLQLEIDREAALERERVAAGTRADERLDFQRAQEQRAQEGYELRRPVEELQAEADMRLLEASTLMGEAKHRTLMNTLQADTDAAMQMIQRLDETGDPYAATFSALVAQERTRYLADLNQYEQFLDVPGVAEMLEEQRAVLQGAIMSANEVFKPAEDQAGAPVTPKLLAEFGSRKARIAQLDRTMTYIKQQGAKFGSDLALGRFASTEAKKAKAEIAKQVSFLRTETFGATLPEGELVIAKQFLFTWDTLLDTLDVNTLVAQMDTLRAQARAEHNSELQAVAGSGYFIPQFLYVGDGVVSPQQAAPPPGTKPTGYSVDGQPTYN